MGAPDESGIISFLYNGLASFAAKLSSRVAGRLPNSARPAQKALLGHGACSSFLRSENAGGMLRKA